MLPRFGGVAVGACQAGRQWRTALQMLQHLRGQSEARRGIWRPKLNHQENVRVLLL